MSAANTNPRLTMLDVTRLLGKSIGRLRADSSFPLLKSGTFSEAEILAWKQARDKLPTTPEVAK